VKSLFFGTLSALSQTVISAVIMYFVLYFLLTTKRHDLQRGVQALVPFSKANTIRLANEFKRITFSTILTSGLIAVIQGFLLTLTFFIFNLPGAYLWGFTGSLMAFVPLIGISSIWVSTVIILLVGGQFWVALGVLGCGLFISTIDNFIRPLVQKKVGSIHPLVSILGIFIGISLFGLLGIVIGPLMLTYFLLTVRMFKEEYIK
jgi:predicted PurR-regulated permease PerM